MSAEEDVPPTHIENVDVNSEIGSNSEKSSDSGIETIDACSDTFPASSDSDISPLKSIIADQVGPKKFDDNDKKSDENNGSDNSQLLSPVSSSPDDSPAVESLSYDDSSLTQFENSPKDASKVTSQNSKEVQDIPCSNIYDENTFKMNSNLAMSTMSLDEQNPSQNVICKSPYSRSAEDLSAIDNKLNLNLSDNNLDKDKILSQFTSQKNRVTAVSQIPDTSNVSKNNTKTETNLDIRYSRIPKEILSQDIGSIVKNVHGIFSSVSGSLKYAYNQRSAPKANKNVKPVPNGKVMNDIFEDENNDAIRIEKTGDQETIANAKFNNSIFSLENHDEGHEVSELDSDTNKDVLKLHVETLERLLFEQKNENVSLRERVKQQSDDLHEKDQTFKEFEVKLDLMGKRVEQAEREKDAAVMRYASVECAGIEARRAADAAAKAEKAAQAEVELMNNKLKSAHAEKQRIIQLYDDKCHELQITDRELSKVREDIKELEGRLKWTQSKLRMEMDAYKDSSERVEKLTQQVTELEAAKGAAAANATDSVKAKQLESELKECRAALILCRHEKEEMERRLTSTGLQLETCKRERDDACTALVDATVEVEKLKINNLHLEEEAAELAALRAKAALADTLSSQLQRESERAAAAEAALGAARAAAETCARREAAALEHAARLTHQHVARRHGTQQHEAKVESERAAAAEAALGAARAAAETCARREAAALEHAARLTHQHVARRHGTQQHEAKVESERAAAAEAALGAARAAAETCARREAAALEHAARLTHQHVARRHGTQQHEAKAQALSADNASLRERVTSLEAECAALQAALAEETERRNKENRVLARKVAELTEEAAEANKRLEWEKGENGVLKKKHSSAIKELNRELQRALKRCEQLEAKLPPPDAPSTRTGSISSLSSVESAQTDDRLQNGHAEGLPEIQVREPDRQALIERIVSLQRAAARRAERCEFLEEHSKQLTAELRNKSRLLRHMLSNMPAGAVASEDRDMNKKEIARLGGGAMAAVWGGPAAGLAPELALEMTRRLQAVLEDTLLKNITLKENIDTLGAEISRLKEKRGDTK